MDKRDVNRAFLLAAALDCTPEEILEGFEAELSAIAEHESRQHREACEEPNCCGEPEEGKK